MSSFVQQIYKKEDASLKKLIFLDRDGTLIKSVNYLSDPSQIHLLPGVTTGIKRLNDANTIVIVVTNQPVVARGLASIKDVKLINSALVTRLNKKDAHINAVYFCPHHPETHHPDIPVHAMKYRIDCECRKPKSAMLKKAVEDFNINLKKVFIIGDSINDIKAGKNLGIVTILVKKDSKTGDNNYPVKPDYTASDFSQAVDLVIAR